MSLWSAILDRATMRLPELPDLDRLRKAAARVLERWPDVLIDQQGRDPEALAMALKRRVEATDWPETKLSFVIAAAAAVFDAERCQRKDLAEVRRFLYAEVRASSNRTFLSALFRIYCRSYIPAAAHTRALARSFEDVIARSGAGLGQSLQELLERVPELLDTTDGPARLATRMARMEQPFEQLIGLGIRNPHEAGFMVHAHLHLTEQVKPALNRRDRIDWYLDWLRPAGKPHARTTGAEQAIDALIHPWLETEPGQALRTHLTETLIDFYQDPRIHPGGVWAGVRPETLALVQRWLTREDLRFFIGVVDHVQGSHMWEDRRGFWLDLFDEGLVDAAWVALSDEGLEYARQHLPQRSGRDIRGRFGHQRGRRGTNTSLLLLKIHDKIMVDGCHSYKTHVFAQNDPDAPTLFKSAYDCDAIRHLSSVRGSAYSKPHNSINVWSQWVLDMINADVPWVVPGARGRRR